MSSPISALHERGALALSLLNTIEVERGVRDDRLATPEGVVHLLQDLELGSGGPAADTLAAPPGRRILWDEARRLRSAVAELFAAHGSGDPPSATALHALNRVLGASRTSWALESGPSGWSTVSREEGSGALALLAPVARDVANTLTGVPSSRLRRCASDRCARWFIDTSRGGQRRWCSMARCGNRAKAAKHRRRLSAAR